MHLPRSTFVSTKVRLVPVNHLAEVGDDDSGINPNAPGRELKHTHSRLGIKTCSRHKLWYPCQTVFLVVWRAGGRCKIIIKIIAFMTTVDSYAVTVFPAHMQNVIPCGAVLYDPAAATQPICTFVVCLQDRIVEDIHVSRHPLLSTCVAHLHERSVGHVPAAARRAVATARDVPPDV